MKTLKRRNIKRGGNVLSSGGFGCVFKPALKCKNNHEREENGVSKLMKKKYVAKEYSEVVKYLPQLEKIPHFQKYFLVSGFSICEPDVLSKEDLNNFDKKCSALTKNGFTKENINKNLGKLKVITMPYGGMDVGKFIDETNLDYKQMYELNKSLQLLLNNGIVPMNREGIYHCDIKDSNVLVQEENQQLFSRLIDWGLSTSFNKTEKKIPNVLRDRPFQFNVPFSNILFNNIFRKTYNDFLEENPNPNYIETRSFVIDYTIAWVDERGPGHLKTLNGIFREMFEKTLKNIEDKFKADIIEYSYTFHFIFEYLSQIVFRFTKNGKFDEMGYFTNVFLKNIDIWGFVMIYIPIFEYLYENYKKLNETELEILNTIKSMFFLLIQTSTEPIDVGHLNSMLQKLDSLFLKASQKRTSGYLKPPTVSSSSYSNKKTRKITTQQGETTQQGGSLIQHYHTLHKSKKTSRKNKSNTSRNYTRHSSQK